MGSDHARQRRTPSPVQRQMGAHRRIYHVLLSHRRSNTAGARDDDDAGQRCCPTQRADSC